MPKLKTKSSCKGRFKITGSGKILFKHTGKRHGMTKKSNKQIRNKRRPGEVASSDTKRIFKKFMSYFKKLRKTI